MRPPRLALVPGEPAGVGPELCVRLAQQPRDYSLTAFADRATLLAAADLLGLPLQLVDARDGGVAPGELALVEIPNAVPGRFGQPDPRNAQAVIDALHRGAAGCLAGDFDGIVTGPVNKAAINEGGIAYSGTTELLAAQAGREVADAIGVESLSRTLRIVHASLRIDFGIADPVIAVLGLNPHAGEAGHLGHEEIEVIEPVVDALRAEGLELVGPLPADTAFLPARLRGFDAVLAMYHDQGLPVLKFSGFEQAVNLTLGLPYPRVAVDHGTALDLAGTGRADPSSLIAAAETCARIARTRAIA